MPGPLAGDRRSAQIEANAALILGLIDKKPDMALAEIWAELAKDGVAAGITTIWRFFRRHRITRKKTAHAAEQDRPDILKRRWNWFASQPDLDPDRLVFIDGSRHCLGRGVDQDGAHPRQGPPRSAPTGGDPA